MVGGAIMGFFGGLHFWWPKMTGRLYPEMWGRLAAVLSFVGFNLTFMPQFVVGYLGMPRRYHYYKFAPEFQPYQVLSTAGATVLALGYALPAIYLLYSLIRGEKAPANPWGATGLEWQTASPPTTENFAEIPIVTTEAYGYDAVQAELDDIEPGRRAPAGVAGG
jgi:cytochrome c oxidase subunit 1